MAYSGTDFAAPQLINAKLKRAPAPKRFNRKALMEEMEARRPRTKREVSRAARASKPCAYGARGDDGRCPKKPKAPCRYGDRVGGRCPKKPRDLSQAFGRDIRQGRNPFRAGSTTAAVGQTLAARRVESTSRRIARGIARTGGAKKLALLAAGLSVPAAVAAVTTGVVLLANRSLNKARDQEFRAAAVRYKETLASFTNLGKPLTAALRQQLAADFGSDIDRIKKKYQELERLHLKG